MYCATKVSVINDYNVKKKTLGAKSNLFYCFSLFQRNGKNGEVNYRDCSHILTRV